MSETASTYAADGVNLKKGDEFSSFCGQVCRKSYLNSRFYSIRDMSEGRFRGPRTFKLKPELLQECEESADPDGNGTRVILDAIADEPEASGTALFSMPGMDGVRYGGRNGLLVNQLDVSTLGEGDTIHPYYKRAVLGLGATAEKQGVVLLKGETAEMGVCVSSEDPIAKVRYLWSGVMISVFHPRTAITGTALAHGQTAVVLREYGLRANGGSSARKAFARWYGPQWYNIPAAREDIRAAAAPCVLYENFLQDMNGWNDLENGVPQPKVRVKAIAHITGGGIPSKLFEDILKPRGFSCELNNTFEPPPIMQKFAKWRGVSGKEPYEIWHGGQGVIVILDEADVHQFCDLAAKAGHDAQAAGVITKSDKPTLTIRSKFDGEPQVWE